MRRIGLILSSLVTVGLLVTAGVAQACPGAENHAGCGCNHAKAAQPAQGEKKGEKKAEEAAVPGANCGCGGACAQAKDAKPTAEPKQGKQQGSLDDRLIRPHRGLDASAGFLG